MSKHKLYMAGKMKDLTAEEAIMWAKEIDHQLQFAGVQDKYIMHIPANFYNYEKCRDGFTEKEIMNFDLCQVRRCDILIVNLKDINGSVGSHFEIATAFAENSFGSKHIAIIGLGKTENIHPWIVESLDKNCETIDDLVDYLVEYYLGTFA